MQALQLSHNNDARHDSLVALRSVGYDVIDAAGNAQSIVGTTVPKAGSASRCAVPYELTASGDDLYLCVVHQSSDGNRTVVVRCNWVGKYDDVALLQLCFGRCGIAHEATQAFVRTEDHFSSARMNSNALHVIAKERAVVGSEVVYHLLPVGTDQVGSIVLRAYPFTVRRIDGDAGNRDIVEQIVSKSAAIIAVYLNLRKLVIRIEDIG